MALCIVHRVWQWAGFEVGSFLLFPSPRIGTFTYSLIPFIYQSLLLKKKKWLDSCIKKTVTNEETEGVSVPKTLPEVNAVWTGAWVDFRKGVVGGKQALLRRAILCKMGWRPGLKGVARTHWNHCFTETQRRISKEKGWEPRATRMRHAAPDSHFFRCFDRPPTAEKSEDVKPALSASKGRVSFP